MKNGTDRPETQETHADNEAWENYYATPTPSTNHRWYGGATFIPSHAKYEMSVAVGFLLCFGGRLLIFFFFL